MHHGYRMAGALDDRSLIGAHKAICCGLCECALEQPEAKSLRGLRQHNELARDGRGDQRSVGSPFDLFNRVHGGQADDGSSELGDRVDGAVDCRGVNERAHRVMHQHDVVRLGGQRGQGVGN